MVINPQFTVAQLSMTRIWHCFGNYMHKVDLNAALQMLVASKTNVLPINTHQLTESSGRQGLKIGFGGVAFDDVAANIKLDNMTLMLNINHQISAQAAVHKTQLAHALTGERVVKLEVLNPDMRTSNDAALIEAVTLLNTELPSLILMPLLSNNYQTAKALVDLGCPLLRVMGSGIGDAQGILNPDEFARICTLPVPVVLDGGVRNTDDLAHAMQLGAQGCLVNSALFAEGLTPELELATFLKASQPVFKQHGFA
jgi:thiazole synthase